MTDIEIPYVEQRGKRYRFFEMLPGLLTWTILVLPFVLSVVSPPLTVFFILAYLLLWLAKAVGMNVRVLQGWRTMQIHQKLDWQAMLEELEAGEITNAHAKRPKWHYDNLLRLQIKPPVVKPADIIHAVIIATYNESREVLEPTIQSVLSSLYDMKKVILVLAYEERGGAVVEQQANELIDRYKTKFLHAMAIKHPHNIAGEIIGKGGNITFAGRRLKEYLEEAQIDPLRVVVTTLDADNRPHKQYFNNLSYTYAASPDPIHVSYQPVSIYSNNIWDAPAPMRVIATGNSFWNVVLSLRPHILRNFAAHAQSMRALIDTDFWSVRTVVEDGHQFWRTYFRYDGKHEVYPLYVPIYHDAVFTGKFIKTLRAQFIQLRRWAWGASDIAYVVDKGFFSKSKAPKRDIVIKLLRLIEGHVSWATAPLILAFSAFIPALFNPKNFAANQLPVIASRVQTIAMVGILVTLFVSIKTLPPKPARYKRRRSFFMVIQWIYLPVTSILYQSMAALNSQTRLIFGRYLGKFDFTEKAVKTDNPTRPSP